MNLRIQHLLPAVALCAGALSPSPVRAGDPIADAFVPPEFLLQSHDSLGITEEQKSSLRESFISTQQNMQKLQEQLNAEAEKLNQVASAQHVEEAAALAQADKVLDAEREIKHAQLTLLVRIKNMLTPEQLAKFQELKGRRTTLEAKMREIQQAAQKSKAEGRDPAPIFEKLRSEVEPAMKAGKIEEALAAAERTLKELTEKSGK